MLSPLDLMRKSQYKTLSTTTWMGSMMYFCIF